MLSACYLGLVPQIAMVGEEMTATPNLVDLLHTSQPSHQQACRPRRPVLPPVAPADLPQPSASSPASFLGSEDQPCPPRASCRSTLGFYRTRAMLPVLFPSCWSSHQPMTKLSWHFHKTISFTPEIKLLEKNASLFLEKLSCCLSVLRKTLIFQQ